MNNVMKRGAYMLLTACLMTGFVGCSDDDPNYDNVTPPAVVVAPNTLTGIITDNQGNPLSGAKVSLDATQVSTDAKGVFLFSDVKAGTYTIKAEAKDKLAKEDQITVKDSDKSQNLMWNASLLSDVSVEVAVSTTEESKGNVETEALKDNKKAEVKVATTVPAGAIDSEEEVKIIVSPIYDANTASATVRSVSRASEPVMLVGVSMVCSKTDVTLRKPVELGFNVDEEVAQSVEAKQYKNGQWVSVASRVEGGKVVVQAGDFAAYGLFLDVKFSVSESSEPISFEKSEWNNLYGAKEMQVGSANYTYKSGTEIKTKGTTVLTALLVEKLAQRFGATISTLSGSYPLNVTLPVGTALTVNGTQSKQSVSVSAMGKSVSGTHYSTVTIVASTYNRQHNGGTE